MVSPLIAQAIVNFSPQSVAGRWRCYGIAMKRLAWIAALPVTLALAGCTSNDPGAAVTDAATSVAVTATSAPVPASVPSSIAASVDPAPGGVAVPLPPCPASYTGMTDPDCVIAADDGTSFTKRRAADGTSVLVTASNGSFAQQITEPTEAYGGAADILARDIDGDGVMELLISTTSSGGLGVNSTWALWRHATASENFDRLGTLFGNEFWDAGSEYVAAYGSGGGWAVDFSRLEAGSLTWVAKVGRTATAGIPTPGSPPCSLQGDQPPVDQTGLTAAEVEQRFCDLAIPQALAHGRSVYSN